MPGSILGGARFRSGVEYYENTERGADRARPMNFLAARPTPGWSLSRADVFQQYDPLRSLRSGA